MTKKDFIVLADTLRANYRAGKVHDDVINDLLNFCKQQNQNFMCDRWLSYLRGDCGPNGGKIKN